MNVRVLRETATFVEIEWDEVAGQQGYVPTIDGSEILTDGKRHFSGSKTIRKVKIGKPTDGRPHGYGVNILKVGESGQVTHPPVDPDPDPDPPPGDAGAKLAAAYPRLVASAPLIDDTGKPVRTSGVVYDGNKGPQRFRRVKREGGPDDGFKVAGGAHDVELELCSATGLKSGGEEQGISTQRGVDRVHVYGGLYADIGDDTLSHLFYFGTDSQDVLLAGVLGHTFSGYGWHGYPGPGKGAAVNTTIVGSKQRTALVVYPGWDLLVVNSILWGNAQGVANLKGGKVTFRHCCLQGSPQSGATYENCIFEDPKLDANFKPTNPKVITGADPEWLAPFDYLGRPYTKATIGAVAA